MVLVVSVVGTAVLLLSLAVGLLLPTTLPAPLRTFAVALITVITLSPLLTIAFDVALRIADHREITFSSCLESLRRFFPTAIRLGLIHLVVGMLTALNVTFYLQLSGISGRATVLLCLYVLLFWSTMALYQGPLLVLQETGAFDEPGRTGRRGAMAVIRRSFFLVVGEPLFSIGLGLAVLLWSAVALLTAVGAAMLWLGGVCILTAVPTRALLAKYGVANMADSAAAGPAKEA